MGTHGAAADDVVVEGVRAAAHAQVSLLGHALGHAVACARGPAIAVVKTRAVFT